MEKHTKGFWMWALLGGLTVGFTAGRLTTPERSGSPAQADVETETAAPGDPALAAPSAAPARPAPAAPPAPPAAGAARRVVLAEHHPRKGPRHAKATLVVFSDFQCPYCSRVLPQLDEITAAYPKDLAVVFVNLPLRNIHAQAAGAAQGFLAAYRQGPERGWKFHDVMFANQKDLLPADLERHAKEAGLDVARWKRDLADPAVEKQLAADEALATRLGVPGTPSFYLNGRELAGGLEGWKGAITEEISRADALLAKGVKPGELYARFLAEADKPIEVPVGSSPSKGPKAAPVTIVAFSEFQCPYCARAVPGLAELERNYPEKVRIAFKHLLIPGHQQAPLAAEASLAAHEQGKFWPYHDKLFENQRELDRAALERYAAELGLDLKRFKSALDSGKHRSVVESDQQLAARLGASATPTFFVNGRKLVGAKSFAEWKSLVDEELASPKR